MRQPLLALVLATGLACLPLACSNPRTNSAAPGNITANAPADPPVNPAGTVSAEIADFQDTDNVPPQGFVALFNGKDLTGWQALAADPPVWAGLKPEQQAKLQADADARMRQHWTVDHGELHYDGQASSLQTIARYRDFEMFVDWSIEKGGDSGIYIRGCPQVQIWDNPVGSGGLYNNKKNAHDPTAFADRPTGQWNRFHIIVKGDRVTVFLNGKSVVDNVQLENYWDRSKPLPAVGPIELQHHGTNLRFKNVFVRDLTPTPPTPAQADHDRRMGWWRDARFGMFIHWGLYAVPAGEWEGKKVGGTAEWIMRTAKIPASRYEQFAGEFNPRHFDADAWMALAKQAGMRYVTITTKHHDGFSLYDSKLTTYDIMDATPFKRDIMREIADAARKQGLVPCWYHSIMDWHHPLYEPRPAYNDTKAGPPDMDKYVDHLKGQLRELLTNYGPIGVLWFDGEWESTWTQERGRDLYDYVRSLAPEILINNRVAKSRDDMAGLTKPGVEAIGDFGTPEQEVPATGVPGMDWESCMTMNDTWGFASHDHNWKSSRELIRTLADIASKGGNFLLNIGPTAAGDIPAPSIDRLKAMGAWMKTNGVAIYGTQASPFRRLPWGRCTVKPGERTTTLYLHVFDWPADHRLLIPGLLNEITSAKLLSRWWGTMDIQHTPEGWVLKLPDQAPDPDDSVIAVEIAGTPAVVDAPLQAAPDGTLTLKASDATIHGSAKYESAESKRCVGFWTRESDWIEWTGRTTKPGRYAVRLEYAAKQGQAGGTYHFTINGRTSDMRVTTMTPDWDKFNIEEVSVQRYDRPTTVHVEVKPVTIVNGALMNLRSVTFVPLP